MVKDNVNHRAQSVFLDFLKDKANIFDLKEKLLTFRSRAAHIVKRFTDRKKILDTRLQILRDLFQEEKRFLLECLSSSKRKFTKDLIKKGKLHEIDRPGGPLEKAINLFYQKALNDYKERFNLWRMIHFQGGFTQEMKIDRSSKYKDTIFE